MAPNALIDVMILHHQLTIRPFIHLRGVVAHIVHPNYDGLTRCKDEFNFYIEMAAQQNSVIKLMPFNNSEENVETSNHLSSSSIHQTRRNEQLDQSENLVPIHFKRLNSSSSLNSDVGEGSESSKSTTASKSKPTRSSWWSVDDFSYPGIPFQVATYLCETSPELVDRLTATLHDTEGIKQSFRKVTNSPSTLIHLSSATDVLNLQETVIDGGSNLSEFSIPASSVELTAVVNHYSAHSDTSVNSTTDVDSDFVLIPSEMSATVDSLSALSLNSSKDENVNIANSPDTEEMIRESSRSFHLELKSMTSDVGSNCEVDSNCELQSNISETSGFEEEMFRIKKLLLESPRSVIGEDSCHQQLDLLRERAALEGRVEALSLELNQVVNERAVLLGELNSTKTQLQVQLKAGGSMYQNEAVKDLNKKLRDNEVKVRELEEVVKRVQLQNEMLSDEMTEARVEVKERETELEQMKGNVGELKVDVEMKEGSVRGLKSKVAELHVNLESALQSKSIVEGDLYSSRTQLSTEQEMKEWYRSQLQQTQASKSKLQQELISLSALLAETESSAENMRIERDQCRRNLAETQRKAVTEKDDLLRRLENIEADIRERENAFMELQSSANAGNDGISNGLKKLEMERSLLAEEKMTASELSRQLEMAQLDSEMRLANVRKMETEAAQFMKQLTVLQKTVSEKELELHQSQERYNELEAKQREQQAVLIAKNELLDKLRQDKVVLEVQLRSAREEKMEMDSVIDEVKNNVVKIKSTTRNMREELNQKNQALSFLEKENVELRDEVKKANETEEHFKWKFGCFENDLSAANEELEQRREKEPRLQEALNQLSDQFTQLQGENALLKDKISILEKYNVNGPKHKSVNDVLQQTYTNENESKLKELLLGKDEELAKSSQARKESQKKIQRLESNVKVLTTKLRETIKEKSSLVEELKQFQNINSNNVDGVASSASKTKDAKIAYYRKKLVAIEAKLNDSIQLCDDERRRADKNQESLIELERQKGKLYAIADGNSTLKQQTSHLEATLSVTEETVSQLHQLNHEILAKKQQEEDILKETVTNLQNRLKLEQDVVKETKKQMFKEKCENNTVKKNLTSARNALNEANKMLDAKEVLNSEIQTEVERLSLSLVQGGSEAADLRSRLSKSQETVEKLLKQVEENRANDPLLADQIKTLSWHLQQKKQELTRLHEQSCVTKERHEEELNRLNEALNRNQRELESLRVELHSTVKEKLAFQSKLAELRSAIKANIEVNNAQNVSGIRLPESPSPCDENLISKLLQKSLALPECRPLSNLQVCVNTLKQEMAILQQQLFEQTNGST